MKEGRLQQSHNKVSEGSTAYSQGLESGYLGTITISGGEVVAMGESFAINKAPSTEMNITASTDVSGTPTVDYVKGDILKYKYIKIEY